jgi:hypothetical protein
MSGGPTELGIGVACTYQHYLGIVTPPLLKILRADNFLEGNDVERFRLLGSEVVSFSLCDGTAPQLQSLCGR